MSLRPAQPAQPTPPTPSGLPVQALRSRRSPQPGQPTQRVWPGWQTLARVVSVLTELRSMAAGAGAAMLLAAATSAGAQDLRALQAGPLRSQPTPQAAPVAQVAAGQRLQLLQMKGGWARVQDSASGAASGWLRASQLDMAGAAFGSAARVDSGRSAANNTAVPLGVRALPAPVHGTRYGASSAGDAGGAAGLPRRHALIVNLRGGVGSASAATSASALMLALGWQTPLDQIVLLRDSDVSRESLQDNVRELHAQIKPQDQLLLQWSGRVDPEAPGCALAGASASGTLSLAELLDWLQPVQQRSGSLLLLLASATPLDEAAWRRCASHVVNVSGELAATPVLTRGGVRLLLSSGSDAGDTQAARQQLQQLLVSSVN